MMEQLPRFIPLVRPKLPSLARSHNTNHSIPSIRAKFSQSLNTIDDIIFRLRFSLFSTRIDMCTAAVDGYEIFGSRVAFCCGARSRFLWWFEAVRVKSF